MKTELFTALLCCAFLTAACGSLETLSYNASSQTEPSLSEDTDSNVFVFATDYSSSGQIYQATLLDNQTQLNASGMSSLGTEAAIKCNEEYLYILHSGGLYNSISTDNLQIVKPFDESSPYTTIAQYSTGNATNPQDVLVVGTNAYIALDYPEADATLIDASGNPWDVIKMDLETGQITHGFSFYSWTEVDNERRAHANKLLQNGNLLFVTLQDYDLNPSFTTNAQGKIGVIDLNADAVTNVITLTCHNPSSLALNPDASKLLISCVDDYSQQTTYSGLEIINLATYRSEVFLSDSALGGYIEKLRQGKNALFAIVATYDLASFTFQSKIITLPYDLLSFSQAATFKDWGADIRDLAVDDDMIWVSYRTISTTEGASDHSIAAYDATTGSQFGQALYPVVAGTSLCVPTNDSSQTLVIEDSSLLQSELTQSVSVSGLGSGIEETQEETQEEMQEEAQEETDTPNETQTESEWSIPKFLIAPRQVIHWRLKLAGFLIPHQISPEEQISPSDETLSENEEESPVETPPENEEESPVETPPENDEESPVNISPEEPNNPDDRFLNSNDSFTFNFGANSGYGYSSFPGILYGPPGGTYDVVSFGTLGELVIALGGFWVVDGTGSDLTIFENPFPGWQECARVSVSDDGTNYVTFNCDQDDDDGDGQYQNCAGATPVTTGLSDADYLDPDLSGGDHFDLADLGTSAPQFVKFIRITDVGLCPSTASTVPSSTSAGFDLDALALINGVNES